MKKIKAIIVLLVLSMAISCDKKNDEDTTISGDVVIVSKKSGDNTVYALAYYAYSFSSMKSVTVTGIANSTQVNLISTSTSASDYFAKEPTDNDFSTTKPLQDTFTFNAVFNSGSTSVAQDDLTSVILDPVTILSCQYNLANARAEFSWSALANADSYSIAILDDSGKIVFVSNAFANTNTQVNLTASTSGWSANNPATGKTYTVRIFAYKYEDSTNFTSDNIQSTSYSQSTVVWGQ